MWARAASPALAGFVFVPSIGATTPHRRPPPRTRRSASFASVESVKAASDVYAPVSGTVTEVNSALASDSAAVNKEAESGAWFVKLQIKDPKELEALLDAKAYKALCDAEKH